MAPVLDVPAALALAGVFAAVFALAIRRPVAGPLALLATLPFDAAHAFGPTTLSTPKAVLAAALGAALVRRLDARVLTQAPAAATVWAAAAVLAATAISGIGAPHDAGEVARQSLKAAEYLAALILGAVAFANDPDEGALRLTVTGSIVLVCAIAAWQVAAGRADSVVPLGGHAVPRFTGPLEGPNQLAGWLDLLLPLALATALRPAATVLERCAPAVAAAALVGTLSRAGLASALLGAAIVLALGRRAPGRVRSRAAAARLAEMCLGGLLGAAFLAGVAWFSAAQAGPGVLLGRLSLAEPRETGGVGHRDQLWRAAWVLWTRRPIFGIGAGNFQADLEQTGLRGVRTHANSLYLQALAEGGLPLLGATLALVWQSTVPLVRRARRAGPIVLGVAAGSLALAAHQLVDLLIFYPKVGETWALLLGIAAAASARPAGASQPSPAPGVPA